MATDVQMTDERDPDAAAKTFGVNAEYLKQLPRHDPECSLATTHHLTCSCGAYGRR